MQYKFVGKGIDVSDKLKDKVAEKIDRLERLFDGNTECIVTICQEKLLYKVEVSIPLKNSRTLRAEVKNEELTAAIDQVVDVIEKQRVKYKTRLHQKIRTDKRAKAEFVAMFADDEPMDDAKEPRKIEKVKRFEVKPMDAEEAVMEMELLGHNFFIFINGDTDKLNVVYKKKNGAFGLIEPEN